MKATQFVKTYGCAYDTVYVHKNNNHPHIYTDGKTINVDVKALIRRREFSDRVHKEAQDFYFEITDMIKETQYSKILAEEFGGTYNTWINFMRMTLFSTSYQEKTLLSYKVTGKLWKFWRFSKIYLRNNKCDKK